MIAPSKADSGATSRAAQDASQRMAAANAAPVPKQQAPEPARTPATPQTEPPANAAAAPVEPPPARASAVGTLLTSDRKARIDGFIKDNALKPRHSIWAPGGGRSVGRALGGDSELGKLDAGERDYLARQSVAAWLGSDPSTGAKQAEDALAQLGENPSARRELVRALAAPPLQDAGPDGPGGVSGETSPAAKAYTDATDRMLDAALKADARTVLQSAEGNEARIAGRTQDMPIVVRAKVWATLAESGAVPAATQERLTTLMLVMEDGNFAGRDQLRPLMADAVANARRPGNSLQDDAARSLIAGNIDAALRDSGTRAMLFDQNIPQEQRIWAMNQVAEGNARGLAGNRFADGWESEAISQAYARAANQPYLARGTEPQTLGGEALRSTVALAMGRQPDLLPENPGPNFLAKGLDQPLFSAGGDNKPVDVVASSIRDLGGDQAQVTIVPITITSNTEGAVTVPLFRVETADGPKFVDHNGDQYRSVRHWEETNKLPKGKMTYAEGLDLGNATLKTTNTPGVVDSFAEAFGQTLDYAALAVLGVGVVVAVVGSGGSAAPLIAPAMSAAGGWGAARAAQSAYDLAAHGHDLRDMSDPQVRSAMLNLAASTLSVGAAARAGMAMKGMVGQAPGAARATAGLQVAATAADGAAVADAGVQTWENWDRMSGRERAGALVGIAFWGGMTAGTSRVGGHAATDIGDMAKMARRLETGTGYPMTPNPGMLPGEVAVRYGVGPDGRTTDVRIEYGGTVPPDRPTAARHNIAAQKISAAGGLTDRLSRLLSGNRPPVGSEAWEAGIEIAKIQREAADVSAALGRRDLPPQERIPLELRQHEIDSALEAQQARLASWETTGSGAIADAARGKNQAAQLGWPDAPNGYTWVASGEKPHLRRLDAEKAKLTYDPATAHFTERLAGPHGMTAVGHGTNEITWVQDANGKLVYAEGMLRSFYQRASRSAAEMRAQREVAARGLEDDQGGHFVGHRFVLDQGMKNLFPQNANFNMGAYRNFEDEVADWISRGYDVKLMVTPNGNDAKGRPEAVTVEYQVFKPNDPGGTQMHSEIHRFYNKPDQKYKRLTSQEMDRIIEAWT